MLDHSHGHWIQVTDKLFEMADRAMHDHCSFVLETSEISRAVPVRKMCLSNKIVSFGYT